MTSYSISAARPILGDLVRRALGRERITISDHRRVVAVVIGVAELEDLEDRAALGDLYAARAAGTAGEPITVAEARSRLLADAAALADAA